MVLVGGAGAPHGGMRVVRGVSIRLEAVNEDALSAHGAAEPAAARVGAGKAGVAGGGGGGSSESAREDASGAAFADVASGAASGELLLRGVGSLTPGYWALGTTPPAPSAVSSASVEWRTADVFEECGGSAGAGGWLRHVCRRDEVTAAPIAVIYCCPPAKVSLDLPK